MNALVELVAIWLDSSKFYPTRIFVYC